MKKNLAIVVRALDHGGAERCASNLSVDLSDKYNVHVVVFDGREKMYPYGGQLHDLNLPPQDGMFRKILNIWKRSKALKAFKMRYNIDCSISLLDGANLVNVLSKANERTIVSIRNYVSASKPSCLGRLQLKYYCGRADKVVALSQTVGLDLIDHYGIEKKKIMSIYNAVDAERLLKLSRESSVQPYEFPYIVTMGRLTRQKGHAYLLRAFSKVVAVHPDMKLVILGQGEDENALKDLAKRLHIEDNIFFPGYIKNPHNIISKSLFFVMPSIYEGLGNVILEAMACGKMVVSTDCLAGPREILAPESDLRKTYSGITEAEYAQYGVLCPPFPNEDTDFDREKLSGAENVLGDTMNRLLNHPEIIGKYEQKSLERIADFTSEKITDEWVCAIDSTESD